MSKIDVAIDITNALGKGIYSVGEDIVLGLDRTREGLGMGHDGRMAEIGFENAAMVSLIKNIVKYGIIDRNNPIYKSIVSILETYYSYFPDQVIDILAKEAGIATGYVVGRTVIGVRLATIVATRIATAIAASAAYKQFAKRLGVSAAAGSSGVGIPITMVMLQGVLQRSSNAAKRLKMKCPRLYSKLERNGDLELIYFLIEKPLNNHIEAIANAERNNVEFQNSVKRKYKLN